MMKVRVELKETSQAIELDAKNAYVKGNFYCVYLDNEKVQKFPIGNVWRVTEDYGSHG